MTCTHPAAFGLDGRFRRLAGRTARGWAARVAVSSESAERGDPQEKRRTEPAVAGSLPEAPGRACLILAATPVSLGCVCVRPRRPGFARPPAATRTPTVHSAPSCSPDPNLASRALLCVFFPLSCSPRRCSPSHRAHGHVPVPSRARLALGFSRLARLRPWHDVGSPRASRGRRRESK